MLFILGIERSATTWVSNLIDAHPAVRVYVEPLSHFTSRFKEWPDRFEKLNHLQEKAAYFKKEFEVIKQRRRWLLTRFSDSPKAWRADMKLSEFLIRKKLANSAINDFYEINFHRKNRLQPKGKETAHLEAIKELRLNFNAEVIPFIDANARVIVVVRDMAANVQSILKYIENGGLAELKKLLIDHYGSVNVETVFKYWRDSYNELLHQLEKDKTPCFTLNHTHLMREPEHAIQAVCGFIGLKNPGPIINYFKQSNREGAGLHNTNRDHKMLLEQNRKARQEVYPHIQKLMDESELHFRLQNAI